MNDWQYSQCLISRQSIWWNNCCSLIHHYCQNVVQCFYSDSITLEWSFVSKWTEDSRTITFRINWIFFQARWTFLLTKKCFWKANWKLCFSFNEKNANKLNKYLITTSIKFNENYSINCSWQKKIYEWIVLFSDIVMMKIKIIIM